MRPGYHSGRPAGGDDFTMVQRTTDALLGELVQLRNKLISKLRSPGERPNKVIKRVFGAGRVLVTSMKRVYAKMMVLSSPIICINSTL
jgi:transposase, IS5 family